MKRLLIILIFIQTLIIIGGGFYVYNNFIKKQQDENKEVVDIRKELELPKPTKKVEYEISTQTKKEKKDTVINKTITIPETTSINITQTNQIDQTINIDTTSKTIQPQIPEVKKEEQKPNPTDIKVDVNIGKIDIPKVGPEIGGGISASGTLALQQAYEEQHDLNKTIQIANDILKSNPNDQIAQKYKKLAELEIMANDALNKGDRQTALNYFYQMQSIDPDNKWAKKGIMKIMSGG